MKILRINMTALEYIPQEVPLEYINLGGRGLTSKLLSEEVDPKSFALGRDNKIIIAPGLLSGSMAPCSGRVSVGAKSPLTGGIKESNAGGTISQYLAGHDIKALVIEGQPSGKNWWVLVINGDEVKFEVRGDLQGLGNYETMNRLKQEYDSDCGIMSIGPAGEQGCTIASLAATDLEGRPTRHAARGGLGAVLGSKGIKAIVIEKPEKMNKKGVHQEAFRETAKELAKSLVSGKAALTKYGTAVLVNAINEVGGLPTNNYRTGYNQEAGQISGETLHELCQERGGTTGHPCHRGCAIRCSNVFHDAQGEYVTAGLEYETIALLGSNCGVNNLDEIASLDYICDDLGLDTMDMGGALGVAMEAGVLEFGDYEAMKKSILSIVTGGDTLGKILGHGAALTGRVLGVERVPVVKGQTMAAYDPRTLKGTGVTYATTPMGADHTAGNALPGRGGIDCKDPQGQTELSKKLQIISMVCDILGVCIFVGPVEENMATFASLTSSFTGKEISVGGLLEEGRKILRTEVAFNEKAGLGKETNDLPGYFRTEALPNNGLTFDVSSHELNEFKY
ncbi:Aldehyde ferredoxin oxidoreductase [Alkaliphilus metalliredigens QYMF]|uniref:Aldehyde ferredoxin oxidoreductase n=1 Tax=Alkaliphilus metalliredigens (strain QYMF) TaxID=293826 RepID=A6TL56_ALKMQ|nr:aldehyde ferredoxin oxidoreductase C-terminal domain-containing protein [Alkaliphilus metalliredigens]ABR46924.1 Aldehyde ferredoxin oxidoreductase [Alkaliphilus metalliredigens QYMF]